MQKQKKMMPTFNKNKRPRQALFAHPNNENSNNAKFQQIASSSSASIYRPSKQLHTSQNSQNPSSVWPMNKNNYNNNRGQLWNGNPNTSNEAFYQPNFQGNSPASSYQNPWHSSPSVPPSSHGFGGATPSAAAEAESINNSWQTWAGMNTSGPQSRSHTPTRTPQAARWPGQTSYPRHHPQPTPSSGTPNWRQNKGPQSSAFPSQSAKPNPPNYQVSRSNEKQQGRFMVDDRSLKVLTASIADMRNWSQHIDKIGSTVCEVFGMMNSAISSDVSGVAKMFTLKDEDQTLKCIFYETDRSLPRLTRDRWLRCVGSLDRRSGLFRCVSARPARHAEQQVVKSLITASSDSMRERLAAVQEP